MSLASRFYQKASSASGAALIPSKELYVDGNRSDVYVEDGSIQFPYKSIDVANSAAVSGDLLHITPATYIEGLVDPAANTTWVCADPHATDGVIIDAVVHITNGGYFFASGITFTNESGTYPLRNHGTSANNIYLDSCRMIQKEIGGNSPAYLDSNRSTETTAQFINCEFIVEDGTGTAKPYNTGGGPNGPKTDNPYTFNDCVFDSGDLDNIAMKMVGGKYLHSGCRFIGSIETDSAFPSGTRDTEVILNNVTITTDAAPAIEIEDDSKVFLYESIIDSLSPNSVIGNGDLVYALVTYKNVVGVFDAGLNSIVASLVEGSDNIIYDNSISGLLSTNVKEAIDELVLSTTRELVVIEHITPANIHGGTLLAGAWRTAPLNTVSVDEIGGIVVAGGTVTLPAGKYHADFNHNWLRVNRASSRIRDVTNGLTLVIGGADYANRFEGDAEGFGIFTLAAPTDIELQMNTQSTRTTYGFGLAALRPQNNVFGRIKLVRLQ